jgi:TonB family protein
VTASVYHQLSLNWNPGTQNDKQFLVITLLVVLLMFMTAWVLSSITLPQQKRQERLQVPERIATIMFEKKKLRKTVKEPEPKPELTKPVPKPEPVQDKKPKVKKIIQPEKQAKTLTEVDKQAREIAQKSGLLALTQELAGLMDTSELTEKMGVRVNSKTSFAAESAASSSQQLLIKEASADSGGIDANSYTTSVGETGLSGLKIAKAKPSLLNEKVKELASIENDTNSQKNASSRAGTRAEEELTLIFDQKKSQLYSLYNRARRKNPALKGKIILQITIAASGKVTSLRIVSSELKDDQLESQLVRRIRNFNFGAKNVQPVTVTYPIEFLPS